MERKTRQGFHNVKNAKVTELEILCKSLKKDITEKYNNNDFTLAKNCTTQDVFRAAQERVCRDISYCEKYKHTDFPEYIIPSRLTEKERFYYTAMMRCYREIAIEYIKIDHKAILRITKNLIPEIQSATKMMVASKSKFIRKKDKLRDEAQKEGHRLKREFLTQGYSPNRANWEVETALKENPKYKALVESFSKDSLRQFLCLPKDK